MAWQYYQTTIAQDLHFEGVGLHTGAPTTVSLYPAPDNTGIVFVDRDKKPLFPATLEYVVSTDYCVTLGHEHVTVKTVEHLLSALIAAPISNVLIFCDGPEIPLLDGSSWPFLFHIRSSGFTVQQSKKLYAVVTKECALSAGRANAVIKPHKNYHISVSLEYEHPFISAQGLTFDFVVEREAYAREIARARTYGFTADKELYDKYGLARGATINNVLIFDQKGPISLEPPRFDQEIVRHKVLDVIGDLGLIGAPLVGKYQAFCPGHTLNVAAARALLAQEAVIITAPEVAYQPSERL
jgi:UDP-3-O-[3-hydroxymyristoyl] N-acetylglucosamine deacetylase